MSAEFALMLAASAATVAPICTDRPTKANAVCTVPSKHFQIESSGVGWSRTKAGGVETKSLTIASSVIKYGIGEGSDLQLGIIPYARIRSEGSSIAGFGDITARFKHRLTGDGAPVQVAIIPFVKLPTAKRGIGNRKVEGGMAIPISFALAGPVTATLGPELDVLADSDGSGRHPAIVNLLNLSTPVASRLTLVGELWSNLSFDPAGTIKQASADAALAYSLSPNAQLDLGANLGLTRETPDVEIYLGISFRS
jgi:hypothetical protein